jgi:hypothetical protein
MEGLTPQILMQIKTAYQNGRLVRTGDVVQDMGDSRLYESDLANFIDEIDNIYKTENAHSPKRSHKNNMHYYMRGKSIDGRCVFCKVSSSYHPKTGEFVCWTLTSFCEWKNNC